MPAELKRSSHPSYDRPAAAQSSVAALDLVPQLADAVLEGPQNSPDAEDVGINE